MSLVSNRYSTSARGLGRDALPPEFGRKPIAQFIQRAHATNNRAIQCDRNARGPHGRAIGIEQHEVSMGKRMRNPGQPARHLKVVQTGDHDIRVCRLKRAQDQAVGCDLVA